MTAKRLQGIGEYYFSQKLREIDELNRQGRQIINLGIGSPDMPPHPDVIKTLQDESAKPNVHAYQSYKGSPVLRKAIAAWYDKWYAVTLSPDREILPLIGSKEGIMHICMTYINEGDDVYVPNPGYPTYRSAAKLAGGNIIEYTLEESNNWLPDFEMLEKLIGSSNTNQPTRLLFVNYPHMPTGQLPTRSFFETLVAFAKANGLLIVHDNPYSFILNDRPASLLSVDGAREVAVELNSLSKSQNMAGWRVGMLCGAGERIDEILRFKSNMDSGMFLPVQLAAAKALMLGGDWYNSINAMYKKRREKVFALLQLLDCSFSPEQAGMFVWAKIPGTYKDGYALSDEVLYTSNVFITPGGIFGSAGRHYVRVSLCCPEQKIEESISRIKTSLKGKK
ncbi:aminotransferase class I/II-fold pyridoxal phosphate-dependent enzyme [Agriterribacter sp.]|uniref:pyridoxal phosphate-dependent aminotransferase n=1 Tax=Agriterribacter sp. TaxID=2821509 RepID=UPI002CFAAB3F|nr:aminotransferase class I/II-fold pyridoxal phosphate-dependent enzyme [Agriterribacter sp.]HRP55589.1 aminotransferase class I/II-fold pyridoxal phosphate-dependent enzyme [Agriterribacter sp.]